MSLASDTLTTLWERLAEEVAAGRRFAGLFGTARPEGLMLSAHLADARGVIAADTILPATATSYPALTPLLGAAFWYEREIADMFGVIPQGHPRPEPLLLPQPPEGALRPRPGESGGPAAIEPDPRALPLHVVGPGLFTIPHGPVRSGVVESIEYLVETPGEDIPHLNMRVFYKHRGLDKRFEGMTAADGLLLAERVEGTATVAHALAYCHALERICGAEVPWTAALVRVLHAELERLACHLDVAVRLADAAGLAVATARFGWHKERVLRLVGQACGSRFGRGVVVPGGVSRLPLTGPGELLSEIGRLDKAVTADVAALMGTASFLDRLRRTGPLSAASAPASTARSARSARRPGIPTTPASSGRTTPTRRSGCASRRLGRRAMRWTGCGSAGTRSPRPSTCSARWPTNWPRRRTGRCGPSATRPTAARPAGPRPRRARCCMTCGWKTA